MGRKKNTIDTKEVKSTIQESTERKDSTLDRPEASIFNRILGGKVRDKEGKNENEGKYGKENAGRNASTWKERNFS